MSKFYLLHCNIFFYFLFTNFYGKTNAIVLHVATHLISFLVIEKISLFEACRQRLSSLMICSLVP